MTAIIKESIRVRCESPGGISRVLPAGTLVSEGELQPDRFYYVRPYGTYDYYWVHPKYLTILWDFVKPHFNVGDIVRVKLPASLLNNRIATVVDIDEEFSNSKVKVDNYDFWGDTQWFSNLELELARRADE